MDTLPATYESIKHIVEEGQCAKLHWPASKRYPKAIRVLCDGTTAHAIVTVYNALSPENRTKMERLIQSGPDRVAKIAALAWR